MASNPDMNNNTQKIGPLKTICFSLFTFLLFLFMLEMLFRTTHLFGACTAYTRPDPVLIWTLVPNAKYWSLWENDHPVTGRINSFGWRDYEWGLKKPKDVYRIAVLGDSFVEALQIESNRRFTSLAADELSNKGLRAELMNFGRSGFSQTEELWVLQNIIPKFSPDALLLFFFPENDIGDSRKETAYGISRPFYNVSKNGQLILDNGYAKGRLFKITEILNFIERRSALFGLIYKKMRYEIRYNLMKNKDKEIMEGKAPLAGFLSLSTGHPNKEFEKSYAFTKRLIGEMAQYCKKKNIYFMLIVIDTNAYIPENEKALKAMDPSFNADYFDDDLTLFARSRDFACLGLQRAFRETYIKEGSSLHGWKCEKLKFITNMPVERNCGHWNYEGHKVVADALVKKLEPIIRSKQIRSH